MMQFRRKHTVLEYAPIARRGYSVWEANQIMLRLQLHHSFVCLHQLIVLYMSLVTFGWIEKEKIGFAFIYVYHHRMQCFCLVASYIDIISYAPETKKFFIHQLFFTYFKEYHVYKCWIHLSWWIQIKFNIPVFIFLVFIIFAKSIKYNTFLKQTNCP